MEIRATFKKQPQIETIRLLYTPDELETLLMHLGGVPGALRAQHLYGSEFYFQDLITQLKQFQKESR